MDSGVERRARERERERERDRINEERGRRTARDGERENKE